MRRLGKVSTVIAALNLAALAVMLLALDPLFPPASPLAVETVFAFDAGVGFLGVIAVLVGGLVAAFFLRTPGPRRD